ncbi:MAG TPA: hypothetical protein VJI46_04115 [Candidatus Nanoarchaeia archaeon]|nr:hypothetical protein [Candidatus Nanoarchaeia archaeon]
MIDSARKHLEEGISRIINTDSIDKKIEDTASLYVECFEMELEKIKKFGQQERVSYITGLRNGRLQGTDKGLREARKRTNEKVSSLLNALYDGAKNMEEEPKREIYAPVNKIRGMLMLRESITGGKESPIEKDLEKRIPEISVKSQGKHADVRYLTDLYTACYSDCFGNAIESIRAMAEVNQKAVYDIGESFGRVQYFFKERNSAMLSLSEQIKQLLTEVDVAVRNLQPEQKQKIYMATNSIRLALSPDKYWPVSRQ